MAAYIESGAADYKTGHELNETRTTIGLKKSTKVKLDMNRAPGQCYDGFIQQLVDLWEHSPHNVMLSKSNHSK